MAEPYDFRALEEKWLPRWESDEAWAAPRTPTGDKRYVLEMYPYPSGDMHMGHVENFAGIGDAIARYWRMRGHDVLHPFGYDALGLPAENAAITRGIHPRDWTYANIDQFTRSCKRLAISYDWDRCFASSDPVQYKWNQWIFLRLLERGLAYRKTAKVNWCPKCHTVLANEQISSGFCWRHEDQVPEIRDLEQWFFKITDYADRLLDDMDELEWPDAVLVQQKNWIGRSEGAVVTFKIAETSDEIPIFTTRPDTLWGVTFFVFAAEHRTAAKLAERAGKSAEYAAFLDEVRRTTDIERMAAERERKAFNLGARAINPLNGEEVPVYASDYVLMEYGTGAIMAVPAHDQRDFEFARQLGLPVRVVIQPEDESLDENAMTEAYVGDGVMVHSGAFDGTPSRAGSTGSDVREAVHRVTEYLEEKGLGRSEIHYRMRDWLISRQRYWGTPFPVVYCTDDGIVPLPDADLPLEIPLDVEYKPTEDQVPTLASAPDWVNTNCPKCGGPARRETDTMDGFMDSSWYFLRFTDPQNDEAIFDQEIADAWMPVDQYIGGIEHAVMHLIYARFITKFLHDLGLTELKEPFRKLMNQGQIRMGGRRMSKSRGNLVAPTDVLDKYGADALRVFILFIGPPEDDYDWPPEGADVVIGAFRFCERVWRLVTSNVDALRSADAPSGDGELRRAVHGSLQAITDRFERFAFNTAISEMMTLQRTLASAKSATAPELREGVDVLLHTLAPIAPYITEELWECLGGEGSIHARPWPVADPALAAVETVTMVVQVDGRVRDRIEVGAGISEADAVAAAKGSESVRKFLDGREIQKEIVRPPKLVNFVTRPA
ncbi:MAG: leucine--tRNA ligase [Actinomycetota bacterium]